MIPLFLAFFLVTGLNLHFKELQKKRAYPPRVWYLEKACKCAVKNRVPGASTGEITGL